MKKYPVEALVLKLSELTSRSSIVWERITHDVLHENKYRVTFFRELYEGNAMDFKMSYYAAFDNGFVYLFLITNKLGEDFLTLAVQSHQKALLTPLHKETEYQEDLIRLHEAIVRQSENIDGFLGTILSAE